MRLPSTSGVPDGAALVVDSSDPTGFSWDTTPGTTQVLIPYSFDGQGSAPVVSSGTQSGSQKACTLTTASMTLSDSAGVRAADTVTVTVTKVNAAGTPASLGTIVATAVSYVETTGLTWALSAGDTVRFQITTAGTVAVHVSGNVRT